MPAGWVTLSGLLLQDKVRIEATQGNRLQSSLFPFCLCFLSPYNTRSPFSYNLQRVLRRDWCDGFDTLLN